MSNETFMNQNQTPCLANVGFITFLKENNFNNTELQK
jgi:hypothetical protein